MKSFFRNPTPGFGDYALFAAAIVGFVAVLAFVIAPGPVLAVLN